MRTKKELNKIYEAYVSKEAMSFLQKIQMEKSWKDKIVRGKKSKDWFPKNLRWITLCMNGLFFLIWITNVVVTDFVRRPIPAISWMTADVMLICIIGGIVFWAVIFPYVMSITVWKKYRGYLLWYSGLCDADKRGAYLYSKRTNEEKQKGKRKIRQVKQLRKKALAEYKRDVKEQYPDKNQQNKMIKSYKANLIRKCVQYIWDILYRKYEEGQEPKPEEYIQNVQEMNGALEEQILLKMKLGFSDQELCDRYYYPPDEIRRLRQA